MVYGAINERNREWYTRLGDVFDAIGDEQLRFNWLITDDEINARSPALEALSTGSRWKYEDGKPVGFPVPAPEYCFLSGEELTSIVRQDDSQWIWGVLSGFERDVPLEEILKYPLPESDEYKGFWKNPLTLQHPLATVEIVPWDACLVLVMSRQKELVDRFMAAWPGSRDLREYNESI